MRIFSGIKPTGDTTIGNHSGGFRQYAATQELGEASFCIVDLHAITVAYEPDDLRRRSLDLAAMLLATGIDPDRSTLFLQSHVTEHAQAAWLLAAVTSHGQLGRMTQFKEKGERQAIASAALFSYPVLMAGDILLYRATHVPIGDDQRQHLELARDIAERFNATFGETFVVPEGIYPEAGARIDGPAGSDREDGQDRVERPRDRPDARPRRRHPCEVRGRRHRLGARDRARPAAQARGHEPDRDPPRRHRRVDLRDRSPVPGCRLRRSQARRGRRRRGAPRADPAALPGDPVR